MIFLWVIAAGTESEETQIILLLRPDLQKKRGATKGKMERPMPWRWNKPGMAYTLSLLWWWWWWYDLPFPPDSKHNATMLQRQTGRCCWGGIIVLYSDSHERNIDAVCHQGLLTDLGALHGLLILHTLLASVRRVRSCLNLRLL